MKCWCHQAVIVGVIKNPQNPLLMGYVLDNSTEKA
jgi:hypothetical protein